MFCIKSIQILDKKESGMESDNLVEFKIKNYDGKVYLKGELQEFLNTPNLRVIANAEAAVFFSDNIPLKRVLASLKVLEQDLKNRIEIEKANLGGEE